MRVFLAMTLSGLLMAGCGDDGGGGEAGLSVEVSWEQVLPCEMFTASDYEVTVAVENEADPVTVVGSVTLCTGAINMVGVNTIECPNNGPYNGTVTVTDALGSDEVPFTISPCMNGSAP